MTESLARAYRPTRFTGPDGVYGQDHAARPMERMVRDGRLAQVILLAGPRGTGKTTLARVLAMALNCEDPPGDGNPCGTCASCTRIHRGDGTMDVVEMDAAANRGVEDARKLRERLQFAASAEGATRVSVIDEAHMLTTEAWNALLKVMEEPPRGVLLVFATTEPQAIASASRAALSRMQRFDLRRISIPEIAARLEGVVQDLGMEAEAEALHLIARMADGGMRDALQILDQVRLYMKDGALTGQLLREARGIPDETQVLVSLDLLLGGTAESNRARAMKLIEAVDRSGGQFAAMFNEIVHGVHALYRIHLGAKPPETYGPEAAGRLARMAAQADPAGLSRILAALRPWRAEFQLPSADESLFAALQCGITAYAEGSR